MASCAFGVSQNRLTTRSAALFRRVAVKEDGSIYWNDEEINKQTLESRLATAAQQTPQPPLNLRGDRTTKMRVINDLTKVAQEQGMLDVGFVATKEKGQ